MTRMTTDVDALSTFLQTGLDHRGRQRADVRRRADRAAAARRRAGAACSRLLPVLVGRHRACSARVSVPAYTEARERVSAVNADFQENVAGVRVAQAFRRAGARRGALRRPVPAPTATSRLRAQRYIATYFPFVELLSEVAAAAGARRRRRPGALAAASPPAR